MTDDDVRHYRLFEVDRHGRGIELPTIYTFLPDAIAAAEWIISQLESVPHRRPQRVTVFDVWTGEIMATRKPDDPARDPSVCALCGQPVDPFEPVPVSAPTLPDTGAGQP